MSLSPRKTSWVLSGQTAFVITDTFGQQGGSHLSALLLCEELVRLGLGVKCFAQSTALGASCSTRYPLVTPLLRRGWRWDWPGKCLAWQARRSIRRDHPDFVFVCGVDRLARYLLQSDAATRLLIWENTNANPGNKFVDPEAVRLLRRARALLSPSATIDQCVRQTYGYAGPLLRLPFWVEDEREKQKGEGSGQRTEVGGLREQDNRTAGPRDNGFAADFIFLGRRDVEKGLNELIRATARVAKKFPIVRVLITGQGTEESYAGLARELHIEPNVTFHCFPTRAETMAALSQSRYLVLPSYHEGYPLVLLEAAQCGVPFIATRVGSVPELFEGSPAALLVPPKDGLALAEAMLTLLSESPTLYEQRRKAAFQLFSSLSSHEAVASRLRKALYQAAHGGAF